MTNEMGGPWGKEQNEGGAKGGVGGGDGGAYHFRLGGGPRKKKKIPRGPFGKRPRMGGG